MEQFRKSLRSARHRVRYPWRGVRLRWIAPVLDDKCILDALQKLSLHPPPLLLVHSSLSACGRVPGGALTVIQALRCWMAGGTIVMPTHSYCYPSAEGSGRLFDSSETPSVVGAITDAFWRQPGVARSLHPTHSLAAEGPGMDDLVAGHEECDTPCGRDTPYERLVEQDAAVLMFGATMNSYTLFHTAEDAAAAPYLYESQPMKLRLRRWDRDEREMMMRKHDMTIARTFTAKDRWLEERGLLRRVKLGWGDLLLLPHSRQVHEAVIEQLRRNPWFLAATLPA